MELDSFHTMRPSFVRAISAWSDVRILEAQVLPPLLPMAVQLRRLMAFHVFPGGVPAASTSCYDNIWQVTTFSGLTRGIVSGGRSRPGRPDPLHPRCSGG